MDTKNVFNSNETLECCDVRVSRNGAIEVETKSYNRDVMERLGVPSKVVRGRIKVANRNICFTPYAESTCKPIFTARATVGCTTIAVTGDKVKLSLTMPRRMGQAQLVMFIEEEMKEVTRRIKSDLYTSLIVGGRNDGDTGTKGGAA